MGETCRIDETDRHSLTVGQAVVGIDLERVGQRVPVVEQGPAATFAFVGGDDLGLDLHAAGNAFGLAHGQQVVAGEEVVLGHLPPAAAQLARRQGCQGVEVADDTARLPEGTDQVLATHPIDLGEVDARLAADRRIDHAQQGCADVDHWDATVPRRGRKACNIGDHPPAHTNHDVVTGETEAGETAA